MTGLAVPVDVLEIAETLERAGFDTWCVGGAVRDALLGHPHLDWDLATRATPPEVQKLFRRTAPVGVRFGTVGVLDRRGVMHEVTTFRRDVRTDGRHAEVEFGATLDEDLARRDFTINAIAFHPIRRTLHDPFGGRADLAEGVVRAVGEPAERMREDRLRALRGIRFAGRFGFSIEPSTWAAIVASAPHLGRLSPERVREELEKTMQQVERPSRSLRLWQKSGALAALVPALATVPPFTLEALDCLPAPARAGRVERRSARLSNRLAALFLDLGGPEAARALKALRFSNQEVDWMSALAERWRQAGPLLEGALGRETPPSGAELRRWTSAVGRTRVAPLLRVAAARWAARALGGLAAPPARRVAALYRRALRVAYRDPIEVADLAVDGDDLRAAGIAPGPTMGKILHALLEAVLEEPERNTRDGLLALAGRLRGESTTLPGGR